MSTFLLLYLAGAACAFVAMGAHYAWTWRRYPATRGMDPVADLLLLFAGSGLWPALLVFGASVVVGILLADRRNGAP